jgi:hypothetical protein
MVSFLLFAGSDRLQTTENKLVATKYRKTRELRGKSKGRERVPLAAFGSLFFYSRIAGWV